MSGHPTTGLRGRASAAGLVTVVALVLGGSVVVGAAGAGVAALAGTYVQDPLERVTIADRVSVLYPRGYDLGVTTSGIGGFDGFNAGGFLSSDVEDMLSRSDRDDDSLLFSVSVRSNPATILGAGDDADTFLPKMPTRAEFIAGARRDIHDELLHGSVLGNRVFDGAPAVQVTKTADGMPLVVATYTWGLDGSDKRVYGDDAEGWQQMVSYALSGKTVYETDAVGIRRGDNNPVLRTIATSIRELK